MGCRFTWTNGSFYSRIDRAMVNNKWLLEGFLGSANFLPSGFLSDHSPVIVSLLDSFQAKRRPFRFLNIWAEHGDFQGIVNFIWNSSVHGSKQFMLCMKMKNLKVHLKSLNREHLSYIS